MSTDHALSKEDESFVQAMLLMSGHVFPFVLEATIELNLFDIIAQAGDGACVSPSEMASQLPTRNPNAASLIDRMLHLLATRSLLSCSLRKLEDGRVERLYALTPTSKFFVKSSNDDTSLAPLAIHADRHLLHQLWLNMKDAILEDGNHFKRFHGTSLYEFIAQDPARSKSFSEGMAVRSSTVMKKTVEMYKGFEGLASLVDVGGSTGACLRIVLSKYPSIKGINYDLPHVVQNAPTYPGIEHVGGNMFVSIPKADAIMLKDVCHNWSDEDCIKILSNCHEALGENGKVIVIEVVMPEAAEASLGSQFAAQLDNMMLMTLGGKERTAREYELLCKRSGFSGFQLVCYSCLWSVMEFKK